MIEWCFSAIIAVEIAIYVLKPQRKKLGMKRKLKEKKEGPRLGGK